jgi:hypothetical protein
VSRRQNSAGWSDDQFSQTAPGMMQMYEQPALTRFGTFRDLTRAGWNGADDHLFFQSIDGCNIAFCPNPTTNNVTQRS